MNALIKQFIGATLSPLVIALLILAVAGVIALRRRSRPARWLAVAAMLVAYFGSIVPVGNALLGPLERQYPPLKTQSLPQVGYVVVLGSSYSPHDDVPVSGALDSDGLARIVEGVNIVRRIPGARLIASGGAPGDRSPSARGYAKLATELGVDPSALIVLDRPLDTWDEANEVKRVVGTAPFILVTSASHMPRAMRLMIRAGVHPIAAPTAYYVGGPADIGLRGWLPNARGLRKTEQALHEYLGLLLMRVAS
jgi:uncharacterized SAM-binding protein YcdF (DUF218 family)